MKKTLKQKAASLAVILCALAIILPALNSCKKESVNTTDLLSTVPSSSSVVVGINLQSLLKKSDCKVDGTNIEPGEEVKAWLAKAATTGSKKGEIARILLNGESGIDPVSAIYFKDAYNDYFTVALANTNQFKEFIEKQTGQKFGNAGNDVEVCANVAIKGAQAWIAEGTVVDPKAIANFTTMETGQSFMAKDFSDKLANMTSDVVGWGEINKLVASQLDFSQKSTMRMALGMMFDDAQSVFFNVDMLKGEAKADVSVLDKDGKPAKYLLPTDKLDIETVKKTGYKVNMIVGIYLSKDLVKKIGNMLSSFGGSQMEKAVKAMGSIDGTMAVSFGDLNDFEHSMRGVVTTDGKAGLDLMQMISGIAPITKDGKLVIFSQGQMDGGLEIAKDADLLKDATMGMVLNLQSPTLGGPNLELKTLVVKMVPKSGSLDCEVIVKAADENRNVMLPIIEFLSK